MRGTFSQDNRFLQLIGPGKDDRLSLTHFHGHEGLSRDFCFTLDCLSPDTRLDAKQWLGKSASVVIHQGDQKQRVFNGVIADFTSANEDYKNYRRYRLLLKPWFHALTLIKNCRIFQNQTVLDIFKTLCYESGFIDIDMSQLGNKYQPFAYMVQYNETNHEFLQRILAEEGIVYTYIHSEDRHVLTLLDSHSAVKNTQENYQLKLESPNPHVNHWLECLDAKGDLHYEGTSDILSLQANSTQQFQLQGRQDQTLGNYYVTAIQHDAQDKTHRADKADDGAAQSYRNQFKALPDSNFFQAPSITRPMMPGPQPAIVVGPPGKMIYTDEFGRIKVQFFWDRLGQYDENSSCWIRVAQMQAGDTWGAQYIPRVGDEVIVDFINGDIDQPIIIGSAYHEANRPVFSAESSDQVVSGLKTKLTNNAPGHEFSMDDTLYREKLNIHSAGDYNISVANDLTQTTGSNEILTLNQAALYQLLKGQHQVNAECIEINVGASQLRIDNSGVSIKPAGSLHLRAKGVPGIQPVARLGDKHQCPKVTSSTPHRKGPIKQGSSTVLVGGIPVARNGDPIQCHSGTAKITSSVANICIDQRNIAHVNAKSDHNGVITTGAANVFIGPSQGVLPTFRWPDFDKHLHPDDVAEFIYDMNTNEFYALTVEQLTDLLITADPLMQLLVKLHDATNQDVDSDDQDAIKLRQQSILAVQAEVNKHMKSFVDGPDDIKITELVHFIGKDPTMKNGQGKFPWINRKHTYIDSQKMKNHWRSYRIDKDFKKNSRLEKIKQFHEKMKDEATGKISRKKLLKAAAKAMSKPKDGSLQLVSFDESAAYKTFAGTIGNKDLNVSAAAQLFRASSGGVASMDFSPRKGKFAFSADDNATVALAQGQVTGTASIPSRQGYVIDVYLPDKTGTTERLINLGSVRADFSITVAGFIGASAAAGANINIDFKSESEKKQLGLKGSSMLDPNTEYKSKKAKAKAQQSALKVDVNAFAGAKVSGDIAASIKWQNPDTLAKQHKKLLVVTEGKPAKELTSEQQAAKREIEEACWVEFAALSADGSAALGAGFGFGFSVGYNAERKRFYIRAHAEAVCGAGLSGSIGYVIELKHTWEFIAFVYHKIKDQNFSFTGFVADEAFKVITNLMTKYLFEEVDSLEALVEKGMDDMINWWQDLLPHLRSNDDILLEKAEQFASNIVQDPEKLRYTTPEVKGRMLALFSQNRLRARVYQQSRELTSASLSMVVTPFSAYDESGPGALAVQMGAEESIAQIQRAIIYVLSYIQSNTDFQNVIQHMTLDGSKVVPGKIDEVKEQLYDALGSYGQHLLHKYPNVEKLINQLRSIRAAELQTEPRTLFEPETEPRTPVKQNKGVANYAKQNQA